MALGFVAEAHQARPGLADARGCSADARGWRGGDLGGGLGAVRAGGASGASAGGGPARRGLGAWLAEPCRR